MSMRFGEKVKKHKSIVIIMIMIGAIFLISGCVGIWGAKKGKASNVQLAEVGPDKCTRCHIAWSTAFDYYRGWDRYGCIFNGEEIEGAYDPWWFPKIKNTAREYYTSEWWNSHESYVWPNDIAERAFSLSILDDKKKPSLVPPNVESIKSDVIFVSKTGGEDAATIQEAVNKSMPGGTVVVRKGVYNETVVLKEGIRLLGQDPYTTVINPENRGHAVTAANNCLISGFTITGTGIDYVNKRFNAGIYARGCDSTLVITGNIFKENGLFGIMVEGVLDSLRNKEFDASHPGNSADYADRPYVAYSNPIIAGNTFYRIGQRAVFLLHGRSEIFNNIFIGNVKTIGMERHSRPFVHHNVFYLNNIPMAINRSEPIVCNNIMYHNQWGQRILKGSNPVIFGNVTWDSPHFRDFDESGHPVRYRPIPGTGELEVDPLFIDPAKGDFHFKATSTLQKQTLGIQAVGIMRDPGLPQPPQVPCEGSFGREVLALGDDILELIRKIDAEQAKIHDVEASYRMEYEGFLEPNIGSNGRTELRFSGEKPAVKVNYEVSEWTMKGNKRSKSYHERVSHGKEEFSDTGAIRFNGSYLEVSGGRFAKDFNSKPDALFIADRPFREVPIGMYRDYDQYFRGSIGPMGTFINGYLRVLGGHIEKDKQEINGHSCLVVRYPHIGKDQYFLFYLDPEIGYKPLKMIHFYNGKPYRVIESYRYRKFQDGIYMPVYLTVTDYAVKGPQTGKKVGGWKLEVNENGLRVNGKAFIPEGSIMQDK
jgi:hypothetical protein